MVAFSRLSAAAAALALGSTANALAITDTDSSGVQIAIGYNPNARFAYSGSNAEHVELSIQDLEAMGEGIALPSNTTEPALEERAIIGADDRVLWTDSNYPYSATGKVQWSNGVWCSGTLIGPRHVITARHCTPTSGENVSLRFSPFYNNGETIYAGSQVTTYIYPSAQSGECVYKEDWAIHILADRLGDARGYFGARGVDSSFINRPIFYNIGYPGDKDNGARPYRSAGGTATRLGNCGSDGPIWGNIDTAGGQSGGPLWEYPGTGDRYVMGTLYGSSSTESVWASGQSLVNAVITTRRDFP